MAEHNTANITIDPESRHKKSEYSVSSSASQSRRTADDVIASLANARENRRARQVNEWETLGHKIVWL